ncbi:MAG: arginine--tRNA ligase [Firmicutes bacterium]|jgi:arginyl-tRNA synthetase|nr:arginine--tRNA ligase [Bacillota bacterium]
MAAGKDSVGASRNTGRRRQGEDVTMDNIMEQVRASITRSIESAIRQLVDSNKLCADVLSNLSNIPLEVPKDPRHGEFASPVALSLAAVARKAPREIASLIVEEMTAAGFGPYVDTVDVAGPGFMNFRLSAKWLVDTVDLIRSMDEEYGQTDYGRGERVLVEFVSANPVGPLNIVNARAAAVGDTLVRLLNASGYRASSEFYVNDAGRQVSTLAESVFAHYMQLKGADYPFPEDGYRGAYVRDIAKQAMEEHDDRLSGMGPDEARDFLREYALSYILDWQKTSLEAYDVHFDRWFSERKLRETGAVESMIREMAEAGYTYEEDGAVWFRSSDYGDDKDRVIVKSDGLYTYVAPDLAYHRDKLGRGFTKLIDILGPDHHGYEGRMQAGLQAFGYPEGTLEVLILQLVTLMRDGEPVKMSKRAGEFITMDDLLEEVPKDAARYFFIMRNTSSHLDFDLNLAKAQTTDNPVWYIQYAHARCCSIFRQAEAERIQPEAWERADLSVLGHASETDLVRKMASLPDEVLAAACERAPSRIAKYALELAGLFHSFYTECRVISDDEAMSLARLALVDAARTVLRNVLRVIGVSAPERM